MAETRCQSNRRIRQEALRDQISAQKHELHVSEILKELQEPECGKYTKDDLPKLKLIIDTKLALIKKYLPDLKQCDIELTGPNGGPLEIQAYELTATERSARIAALLDAGRTRRDGEADND